MNLKDLKEKFHDLDVKFSSKFHKKDNLTGTKKISSGRVLILLFGLGIISFTILAIITATIYDSESLEQTNLILNTEIADISNKTNFTIHGQTDIGANVTISSEKLKLSSVTVKVDKNGKFKYTVNIPDNVDSAFVYILAETEDKNSTNKSVYITRGVFESEPTGSVESDETTDKFASLNNPENVKNFLTNLDVNGDDLVDIEEMAAFGIINDLSADALGKIFYQYDTNKDEKWDIYEIDSFFKDNPQY